jgi:sporulation protein YlmC with PRC-barrel domain
MKWIIELLNYILNYVDISRGTKIGKLENLMLNIKEQEK